MAMFRHTRALRSQNTSLCAQRRLVFTSVLLSSLIACLHPMQVSAGQGAWKGTTLTGDNGWQEISVQAGDKSAADRSPENSPDSGLSGNGDPDSSTRSSGNLTSGKVSSSVSRRAPFTIVNAVATPTSAPTTGSSAEELPRSDTCRHCGNRQRFTADPNSGRQSGYRQCRFVCR